MNLKKLKVIIIVLVILTLSIITAILILNRSSKNYIGDYAEVEEYVPEKVDNTLQYIDVYMNIRNKISTFLLYKNAGNTTAVKEITEDTSSFSSLEDNDEPVMLDVVYRTGDTMHNVNFVKFRYYKQQKNYYAVIILDRENMAYKIIESNSSEYENAKNGKIESKYTSDNSIEQKKYNKLTLSSNYTEKEIIEEYFINYIQKARYYPQEAYNNLNEEYRKKRFGNFEKFQEYLKQKNEELESLDIYSIKSSEDFATEEEYDEYLDNLEIKHLDKYQVNNTGEYTEYTCIDEYGNYYIFKVKGAMEYEVYLDNYTVDVQSFVKKYNSSTEEEKVVLNVNKFLNAVKDKNYSYAYSKLSEDFVKNYIKSEELFKTYMETMWIKYEEISSVNVENKDNVYKCTVKTKDGKTKQFIVKLKEGTDFVMSFTI